MMLAVSLAGVSVAAESPGLSQSDERYWQSIADREPLIGSVVPNDFNQRIEQWPAAVNSARRICGGSNACRLR
jgi:hypothetical protein